MSPGIRTLAFLAGSLSLFLPGPVLSQDSLPPGPGMIRGRVMGGSGAGTSPLPNAIVTVSAGLEHYTVTTDSMGRYGVRDLSPGAWTTRAIHVGYRAMSVAVRVPADGTVSLDLSLAREPVHLPTLVVQADRVRAIEPGKAPPPSELGEVALRALEGSPGMVEGGLAQVVRSFPGSDPSEPRDVLLMRGSAADLKLVLLDGAPVYTPFHMAGLVDSFDPRALGGASLFLGGAPSRFDGGLSYVLDLRGRSPREDRIRGSAAVDLLTGRVFLEGPVSSSTGFLVSARTLHDLGMPLLSQGSTPYGFGDFLTRWEWKGPGVARAHLTGFWNRESVLLNLPNDAENALNEALNGPGQELSRDLPSGDEARWGNQALAAGLRWRMGRVMADLKVARSRYRAELPVGDSLPLFAESRSDRTRLTADFSRPWDRGALRFGLNLDRLSTDYTAVALDTARVGEVSRLALDGSSAGAYLEATRPLSSSVALRAGGRMEAYEGDGRIRITPRVSVTWMLTEDAALTLAAGRYHQYSNVAPGELERTIGNAVPDSLLDNEGPLELTVGTADHLVISLDQTLAPNLRLGLEGFVKEFSGVSGTGGRSLNASGVDLRVARDGERTSGWLGYTLTWFWASDGLLASGDSPFSGRHLLSAGLTTSLSDRAGLRVRASYGDGLPFTSVPVFRDEVASPASDPEGTLDVGGDQVLNSAPELTVGPDEGFLRLELEIFGHWYPQVSGRTMEIRPYLRVLNALNRRDALFYHFDPWRSEGPQPLADLPVLPLLGLEWRF